MSVAGNVTEICPSKMKGTMLSRKHNVKMGTEVAHAFGGAMSLVKDYICFDTGDLIVWLQWPNVDEGWPNVDEGWAFGQMFCSAAGGQKPVPLL